MQLKAGHAAAAAAIREAGAAGRRHLHNAENTRLFGFQNQISRQWEGPGPPEFASRFGRALATALFRQVLVPRGVCLGRNKTRPSTFELWIHGAWCKKRCFPDPWLVRAKDIAEHTYCTQCLAKSARVPSKHFIHLWDSLERKRQPVALDSKIFPTVC